MREQQLYCMCTRRAYRNMFRRMRTRSSAAVRGLARCLKSLQSSSNLDSQAKNTVQFNNNLPAGQSTLLLHGWPYGAEHAAFSWSEWLVLVFAAERPGTRGSDAKAYRGPVLDFGGGAGRRRGDDQEGVPKASPPVPPGQKQGYVDALSGGAGGSRKFFFFGEGSP